jgi:cbb3-type cytochrome oxidase subunit 3
MHDAYSWVAFFGAPLFLLLVAALIYRPSARERYREAKQVIFADEKAAHLSRSSLIHPDKRSTKW